MEIILNDFSLDGQFRDVECFFDSLNENTFPAFQTLKNHECEVLSSHGTYGRLVTESATLHDLLTKKEYRGIPELSKFRSILTNCAYNPYWEDNPKTDNSATYEMRGIGRLAILPNSISEAIAREASILSFPHNLFQISTVCVLKDDTPRSLNNIFNRESAGEILFRTGHAGFSELLLSANTSKQIVFWTHGGHCYVDDEFETKIDDIEAGLRIFKSFKDHLEIVKGGWRPSRFTKSVTHKGKTYYEFRCTFSDDREFRIYYIVQGEKLIHLNALVKKTETIPGRVKDHTLSLINEYHGANY